jgi:hypothetical protein
LWAGLLSSQIESCKDNTLLTADVIGGNAVNTCDNRAAMTLFIIEYCVIAARFLQTFSLLPQIPLRFISG